MAKRHLRGGTIHALIVQEVIRMLKQKRGNIDQSAQSLGIMPRTLRYWIKNWPELNDIRGSVAKLFGGLK